MRKKLTLLSLVFLCFLSIFTLSAKVEAKNGISNSPYTTQIIGIGGELVNSSTAYEGVFVYNPGFSNPSDIFITKDDIVYVADSGNGRVFVYNHETGETGEIGKDVLMQPTGVWVTDEGYVYVADQKRKDDGSCYVYKFDNTGKLVDKYGKPTQSLYGSETEYIPTKVAVDSAGNIFITCQGNTNGIVQLNSKGEFLGYFGPNKVNITFDLLFKRFFMSEEDREIYASLSGKATTNITIDKRNTVYSVIDKEGAVSLKKYNVNGINILSGNTFYTPSYQDVWVDDNGFIYAVDNEKNGVVSVIDTEGNLLFKFGDTKSGSTSIGQFDKASGVSVDSKGNIWVVDSNSNTIQVFMCTEYANTVMNALLNYNEGEYDRAVELYNEVIEKNASFVQAYIGLGKICQRNQQYEEALEYFRISEYKTGYSEVYWELRDDWLGNNLIWALLVIVLLCVLKIFHVYGKIYNYCMPEKGKAIVNKIKDLQVMKELKYLGHILKHPFDTFYDIKFGQKIRMRTAIGLLLFFIAMNIACDYFITGYLFRPGSTDGLNLGFELLKWGLIIVLFIIANYLISSLQNGEGFFRDIFISTVFCFAPLILFKLPLSIISNVMTYNETYLFDLATTVMWAVSIFYCILMIKDIHNYKVGGLVLNIVLTAVAMIVMVLIYLMVYILSMQLIEFFINLIEEAVYMYG